MPKNKIKQEFAIKLIHPDFGDYYFSHFSWHDSKHSFVFVKDLSKVEKWKTIKFTQKNIENLRKSIETDRGKIMLSFGENVDDSIKHLMILSKKKYYLPITDIKIISHLNDAIENLNMTDKDFQDVSINFIDNFKNIQNDLILKINDYILDDDSTIQKYKMDDYLLEIRHFLKSTIKLHKTLHKYVKNKEIIKELQDYKGSYIDIVDASYNFRTLKLRTLNSIYDEE